jgi:hypothetical protein
MVSLVLGHILGIMYLKHDLYSSHLFVCAMEAITLKP